ncbi:MAG: sugar ABC transporter permease [Chloroflexi bacterium]|nr:sugar ABC transporter permease [Chloroflexota bacterium]
MAALTEADTRSRMTAPRAAPRKSFWRLTNPYLYIIPAMVVMAVMTYYPMAFGLWMSFTDYGLKNLRVDSPLPNFVGLDNYADILSGAVPIPNFDFVYTLFFNLFWTFSNVVFHVVIGVLIAVLLNAKGLWFKGVYRAIFILPIVLPTLVVANVWRNMYDPDFGALNQGLAMLGGLVGFSPATFHIRWMESVNPPIPGLPLPLSYFALLITNIWLGWPFMTIVATGALQSISKDYYEAASIDGASPSQQFFNITVPLLRPAMVPAIVYGITLTFNLFNLIYFVSGGGPLRQTEILVTTAFRLVNEQRLYGIAAAFAVYIAIILLIITLITNRISRATESYDV